MATLLGAAVFPAGTSKPGVSEASEDRLPSAAIWYTFTVLATGEYRVGFRLREGFAYSPVWGADKDNKVDPNSGYAANFTLSANEKRTNISSGQVSTLEYGYLPPSFANTILADDGARHIVARAGAGGGAGTLYLGSAVTTSVDGFESATASGHGDGVVRPLGALWVPGATGTLTVTASGAGKLWGWFDWNGDGEFGAGEAVDLGAVVTGTLSIAVPVAANYAAADPLFARIRLYPPDYALQYAATGAVYDGEVEDYGWYTIRGTVFDDVDGDGVPDMLGARFDPRAGALFTQGAAVFSGETGALLFDLSFDAVFDDSGLPRRE